MPIIPKPVVNKKCIYCDHEFTVPYHLRHRKFCNKSCATTYRNFKKLKVKTICKNCKSYFLKKEGYCRSYCSEECRRISYDNLYGIKISNCAYCQEKIRYGTRKKKFCDSICQQKYLQKQRLQGNLKILYRNFCRFNFDLKVYENEFNFNLIKNYGWFNSVNNKKGITRDHIYSVMDGFRNMINPLILAHPANCQLLSQPKNNSKNCKSMITLDELLNKIKNWNKKYGKYYQEKVNIKLLKIKDICKI